MNTNIIKLKNTDWAYFAKWWRDDNLINMTSGNHDRVEDLEIQMIVSQMACSSVDLHWLIMFSDRVVGHINLNKIDEKVAELQIVIGEKAYWGKGIGYDAIKLVLIEAKKHKFSNIIIEVRPENIRAIKLYEKSGFKSVRLKRYPDNHNQPEVLLMELIINQKH